MAKVTRVSFERLRQFALRGPNPRRIATSEPRFADPTYFERCAAVRVRSLGKPSRLLFIGEGYELEIRPDSLEVVASQPDPLRPIKRRINGGRGQLFFLHQTGQQPQFIPSPDIERILMPTADGESTVSGIQVPAGARIIPIVKRSAYILHMDCQAKQRDTVEVDSINPQTKVIGIVIDTHAAKLRHSQSVWNNLTVKTSLANAISDVLDELGFPEYREPEESDFIPTEAELVYP